MLTKARIASRLELIGECKASVLASTVRMMALENSIDVLRAPALYNASKINLLWIVGDERAKLENCAAEMTIWAAHDVRDGHT